MKRRPIYRAMVLVMAASFMIHASAAGMVVWLATWPEEFRIRVVKLFGLLGPYEGWPVEKYAEMEETLGRDFWGDPFHNLKSITEALMDYDSQGWSKLMGFIIDVLLAIVIVQRWRLSRVARSAREGRATPATAGAGE